GSSGRCAGDEGSAAIVRRDDRDPALDDGALVAVASRILHVVPSQGWGQRLDISHRPLQSNRQGAIFTDSGHSTAELAATENEPVFEGYGSDRPSSRRGVRQADRLRPTECCSPKDAGSPGDHPRQRRRPSRGTGVVSATTSDDGRYLRHYSQGSVPTQS